MAGVVNCEGVRNEDCDSDGELVTMETCVFAVFEFISGLVDNRQLRKLLHPILPTLTLNLISHMQLTHSQVPPSPPPCGLHVYMTAGGELVGRRGSVCGGRGASVLLLCQALSPRPAGGYVGGA